MEWDSKSCTWNGVSKLEVEDNSYHHHLATLAGSGGSGITNMFSVDLKLGRLEDMGDMSMETLKNSLPLNMASSSFFAFSSPLTCPRIPAARFLGFFNSYFLKWRTLILKEIPEDGRVPKTKIVCTLGPASRSVPMLEKLLRAGMNVARFNFSHGTHEYHQETLENIKIAMQNTQILCALMLDTKGPEIRTGFLKDGKPIQLTEGQEITVSTDYTIKGDTEMICMSYKKLAVDLKPGNIILCADGTITLAVLSCDPAAGTVRCRCENTAMLGERKNVNLPGVVVDPPTLTEKDTEDILE